MKKITLVLLAVFISFSAFAERDKRISFAVDFAVGRVSSDLGGDEVNMLATHFGADAEFMRLEKNVIIGLKLGVHSIDREGSVSNGYLSYDYIFEGTSFTLAPIIGKAFGQYKNIHLLWYPVAVEFASFTDASIYYQNGNKIRDLSIDDSCINIKTCFYANLQCGKNLLRNGLYTGFDIYITSSGDMKSTTGTQWVIGYKLSFAV